MSARKRRRFEPAGNGGGRSLFLIEKWTALSNYSNRHRMGFIEPKRVVLKDGREALVRTGEERDADQLIENGKHFIANGEGQVLVPDELNRTHDEEIKWIQDLRAKSTNLLFVAEVDSRLVGHLDFNGGTRKRLQHTGRFGMAIREEFRSRGVGKALGVTEKINLQVLANNGRAIALYESLGFVETGRRRKEIKLENEAYLDDVSMELQLY